MSSTAINALCMHTDWHKHCFRINYRALLIVGVAFSYSLSLHNGSLNFTTQNMVPVNVHSHSCQLHPKDRMLSQCVSYLFSLLASTLRNRYGMGTLILDVLEYINFPSSSKDRCNLQQCVLLKTNRHTRLWKLG